MGKLLVKLALLALGLYAGGYVFNHYNPWLGILIALLTVIAIIYLLFKKK